MHTGISPRFFASRVLTRLRIAGAIVSLFAPAGLAEPQPAAQQTVFIAVSAAISLKDALGHAYEQSHLGAKVTLNDGGFGTWQPEIEHGAPVDVFISAARRQMNALESKWLIDAESRRNIVANELVLVVPATSNMIRNFQDLARPEIKVVALSDPGTVPAGMYAWRTLDHLGLLVAVEKKTVGAKDDRQALTYVEIGNADAGLVYRSDARIPSKDRIAATAPAASHGPIVYPAPITERSKNGAAAHALLDFLGGPAARAVFEKYGFTAPEKQAETN
jgi:molybdate transport system substrate-binding protein